MTSIEWLFNELWETPKDKLTWHSILSKAKEMESSQTEISDDTPKEVKKDSFGEISDEEIEKESWGYREVTKDMEIPPNEDWSNGAKWYREQLKSNGNGNK